MENCSGWPAIVVIGYPGPMGDTLENELKLPAGRIAGLVLDWYDRHRRDLPWRKSADPWAVMVSEFMLQQTRVETVIPYFHRFMARFPDPAALAEAPLDDVLKCWENLGYYSRARNLHRAAGVIMSEHGGRAPEEPERLLRLPGVGPYVAGAIASIAFGKAVPAVDGNVRRVIARAFLVSEPVDKASGRKRIDRIAGALVPAYRPGDFNQGLMELGATVCTPKKPDCDKCPIASLCAARSRGMEQALPIRSGPRPAPHVRVTAGIVRRPDGRVLLVKRPEKGLLAGLWKWPGGDIEKGESLKKGLERSVREETGLNVRPGKKVGAFDHAYTHRRITLHVFACRVDETEVDRVLPENARWVAPERIRDLALSKVDRMVEEYLEKV